MCPSAPRVCSEPGGQMPVWDDIFTPVSHRHYHCHWTLLTITQYWVTCAISILGKDMLIKNVNTCTSWFFQKYIEHQKAAHKPGRGQAWGPDDDLGMTFHEHVVCSGHQPDTSILLSYVLQVLWKHGKNSFLTYWCLKKMMPFCRQWITIARDFWNTNSLGCTPFRMGSHDGFSMVSTSDLTHLPLVLHICISELCEHWFR